MSDYLITQIEATPNVEVRLGMRVVDGRGEARLEALTLEDVGMGRREEVAAAAVFVLIGAEPRTEWLRDIVQCDDRGFILTGAEAGHAVRLEAGGRPVEGALGRAGLPRPLGRRGAEEHDRADELVGELLGEPGQQAELVPVVGRFPALARRAWHSPLPSSRQR